MEDMATTNLSSKGQVLMPENIRKTLTPVSGLVRGPWS